MARIDHSKLVDSFGTLHGVQSYTPLPTRCGGCGVAMTLSPATQKLLFETLRVPVSKAGQGVARCPQCRLQIQAHRRKQAQAAQAQAHIQATKAAALARPSSGPRLLDYVAARIQSWTQPSPRAVQKAQEELNRARRLDPTLHLVHYWQGHLHAAQGQHDAAAAAWMRFLGCPGKGFRAQRKQARALLGL